MSQIIPFKKEEKSLIKHSKKGEKFLKLLREGDDEYTALTKVCHLRKKLSIPSLFIIFSVGSLSSYGLFMAGLWNENAAVLAAMGSFLSGIMSGLILDDYPYVSDFLKTLSPIEREEALKLIETQQIETLKLNLYKEDINLFMMTVFDFCNEELGLKIKCEMLKHKNQKSFLLEIMNPESKIHQELKAEYENSEVLKLANKK